MKNLSLILALIVGSLYAEQSHAQYQKLAEQDGVVFYSRWTAEKWYKPKGAQVLVIKVVNTTMKDMSYSFEVTYTKVGKVVETGVFSNNTIGAGKERNGRLNGHVILPAGITVQDVKDGKILLEIEILSVEPASEQLP